MNLFLKQPKPKEHTYQLMKYPLKSCLKTAHTLHIVCSEKNILASSLGSTATSVCQMSRNKDLPSNIINTKTIGLLVSMSNEVSYIFFLISVPKYLRR